MFSVNKVAAVNSYTEGPMEGVLLRAFEEVRTHVEIRLDFLHLTRSKKIFLASDLQICVQRCEGFAASRVPRPC